MQRSHFYRIGLATMLSASLMLVACGGQDGDSSSTTSSSTSGSSSSGSNSSSSGSSSSSSSSGSGSSSSSSSSSSSGGSLAAQLAVKLGKPKHLLIGLGTQGSGDTIAAIDAQNLHPDIYERYLNGVGSGDWTTWNSPAGEYVTLIANQAAARDAVPMYTLYQMAQNGDGNLSGINNSTFMTAYWANVKLMFQKIAATGKPALVNFEPDFWGYVQQQNPGNGAQLAAVVSTNADCSTLANTVTGLAGCLIAMARKYAPLAYVGFPPSDWGANGDVPAVVTFMNQIGAQHADYIVMQTLDRDGGCFEAHPSYCSRTGSDWYWDESNQTSPTFTEHFADVQTYHLGIGGLPIIWWQTPLGVPSSTPGGTDYHYRDNRVHYFLTHPAQLTAVGGLGVVFSTGESHQTNITTDNGQFQTLSTGYLAAPAALP